MTSVVGTVEKSDSFGFLILTTVKLQKIFLFRLNVAKNAVTGDKALRR